MTNDTFYSYYMLVTMYFNGFYNSLLSFHQTIHEHTKMDPYKSHSEQIHTLIVILEYISLKLTKNHDHLVDSFEIANFQLSTCFKCTIILTYSYINIYMYECRVCSLLTAIKSRLDLKILIFLCEFHMILPLL